MKNRVHGPDHIFGVKRFSFLVFSRALLLTLHNARNAGFCHRRREVAWSVYLLCLSVNPPCKTDEPIEMHAGFWKQTREREREAASEDNPI